MPDLAPKTPPTPAPAAPPIPSEEVADIQTIPDQFYGAALKAKAPLPAPSQKAVSAATGGSTLPVWVIPTLVGVVLLLGVAGGFWYFNPNLFAPKPAPVVVQPEPEPEPEPEPQPPTAPTNVQATSTEGGSVRITWEDASTNEAGFRVERREGTAPFAPVSSSPPNSTLFLDTTTVWEQTYAYRVIAINQDGEAMSASEASVTVPENPVKPVEVVELPPAGLDTDSDGLTDLEEPLYGSPTREPDADKDTFLDGNEVFHLYTPSGKAPGLLRESGLVRVLESSTGWSLFVPTSWQASLQPDGLGATILTGHGEQFRIRVETRAASSSVLDWYLAQNPGVLSSQVEQVTTKGGLEGIVGMDRLTTAFPWGNDKVFVVEYRLEGQPFVNFRTTYEMMKNSLTLGAFTAAIPAPAPAPTPAPAEESASSTTQEVPAA